MGVIQNSINQIVGSTTQAAGIAKGISELKKKNELEVNKVKGENMTEVAGIQKEYNEDVVKPLTSTARELKKAKEEQKAASAALADATVRGTESDPWFPSRKPATQQELEDLAGKVSLADTHVKSYQELQKAQKSALKKRKAELQERLDLVNQKGALYGIAPAELKGGKK